MKEAKKEAEALANAYRAEKEASYQASMQKVGRRAGHNILVCRRHFEMPLLRTETLRSMRTPPVRQQELAPWQLWQFPAVVSVEVLCGFSLYTRRLSTCFELWERFQLVVYKQEL